jgi:hypothetical protein
VDEAEALTHESGLFLRDLLVFGGN